MLHLSSTCNYYLYNGNADMRKGFDSLYGLVSSQMQCDVLSVSIFIFINNSSFGANYPLIFLFYFVALKADYII